MQHFVEGKTEIFQHDSKNSVNILIDEIYKILLLGDSGSRSLHVGYMVANHTVLGGIRFSITALIL